MLTFPSPEVADVVVLTRGHAGVLHTQTSLGEGHHLISLGWPVLVTLGRVLLDHSVQHDDGPALLLPDHGPEVRRGAGQGTLGQDDDDNIVTTLHVVCCTWVRMYDLLRLSTDTRLALM